MARRILVTQKVAHEMRHQVEINISAADARDEWERTEAEERRVLMRVLGGATDLTQAELKVLDDWANHHPSDDDGWTNRPAHRLAVRRGLASLREQVKEWQADAAACT